ncbi:MAG: glycosyltransferase 87 family protein [Zavarzinella sp.]
MGAVIISCRWWQDIFPGIPWWHVLILSLPLIAPNIKNGQVNPYVFLLMTGAVCGALRGNFWWAAWSLALAVAFKVYPISLGLLLLIIYPRQLLLRLLIASAVLFFLPLFLKWDYSWQQYLLWFEKLASEDRTMQSIDRGYRDFQKILMTWGLPTSIRTYRIMEVLAGMVLAAICLKWRGLVFTPRSERTVGQFALFSSLLWCTLFGPATESATYMLLAIPAAWAVLIGATTGGNNRFLAYLGYGLLLAMLIGQWFPKDISYHVRVVNPQPYGAIALGIWLIWYFRQQKVAVAGQENRPPHST